jgi:hypothetical protein
VSNKKSVSEKTSAEDKSIGFEYQYYYFLDRLLNLKGGQSVGLEVEDDVHVEFDADLLVLFQLKHTVRKAADGQPIALPELDIDIWKTIHNWSNVITDQAHSRTTSAMQLAFVRKTEFHLVTNKSQSKANNFLVLLEDLKRGMVDFLEVKSVVLGLYDRTEDATIKGYIKTLIALNDSVAEQFLRRIFVELALVDIIARVKACIRDRFIDENRINEVFERLDSNIRQDNFIAIKTGKPVLISYDQFMQKYRNIFVDGRSKALPAPAFTPILPDEIFAQLFIKRLIEIEALAPEDVDTAIDYTLLKLRIARYLESWVQTGDLISDEVDALHKEVFRRWKNKFQFAFRKCTSMQDVIDKAIGMLVELREECFKVGPSELDTDLSNGELYYLSDDGKIGWHRDWETL